MRQELYINNTIVPLKEDVPVPVTYAIADVREPDKRKSSISKTINIPGSKEVNKLFGHIYDIGVDTSFDPNKKADAVLYVDSIPVLTGSLQLSKINRLDKEQIEYECILFSALADIITSWGDTLLETLDLSEYSHPTNERDIQWNSLDASLFTPSGTVSFALGKGYVYPIMDTGGYGSDPYKTPALFAAADLFPAVYVKTYWDKAFALAGFRYSSTFLNTNLFNSLIIPYQNTDARRPKRTLNISFNIEVRNGSGNSGSYKFNLYAGWRNKLGAFHVELLYQTSSLSPAAVGLMLSSASIQYDEGNNLKFYIATDTQGSTSDEFDIIAGATITAEYADLGDPDSIAFYDGSFSVEATGPVLGSSCRQNLVTIPLDFILSDPDNFFDTSTYSHTSPWYKLQAFTPKNIKIRDFFKSFITMFNLMVLPDKDDSRLLHIEPYNSFFDSSKTVDWSGKWATDKPVVLTPLPQLTAKKYTLAYKSGERDYYNDKYFTSWQEVYGQHIESIENDFMATETKYELPYAPTPLAYGGSGMVFPAPVKSGPPTTPPPYPNAFSGNFRILYYGGKIASSSAWNYRDYPDATGVKDDNSETTYGYAGHFDNPWTPTLDINWDLCAELYYPMNPDNYTDNNLYNAYWKQFMDNVQDKNSKLIEAWFYLTPLDIAMFDFRGYVFFDKYLCKINQIIDYNPTSEGLTKVELLTIKEGVPFTPSTKKGSQFNPPPVRFSDLNTTKVTINHADVSNLHSSPVTLIDPVGDGTVIHVVEMVTKISNSTTAYSTNTTLAVAYTGYTAAPLIEDSNILTQTSGLSIGCSTCSGGTPAYENTGIVAYIETGDPEAGDGDLTISLTYKIIDIS